MWFFIRMVLVLVVLVCIIIAIYKTYKTLRMKNQTMDETLSRFDNQMDAFKYAVIAFVIVTLLSLTRGV